MTTRRKPPLFSGNVAAWAQDITSYLSSDSLLRSREEPSSPLLAHKMATGQEKAAVDGILLFDPVDKRPLVSIDGAFVKMLVTGDAGGGGGGGSFTLDDGTATAGGVFTFDDGGA